MRVAIYGGSFNPPHVGHLMVASWVRWADRADAVWLLPSFAHPFSRALQPFEERVAWCRAAAALVPGVEVCTLEAELPAPSYSIDVLDALASRYREHRFRWVLGADQRASVSRWKAWDRIEAEYDPIWVGRAGQAKLPDAPDMPDVSASEIRARVREGLPIDALVPAVIHDAVRHAFSGSGAARVR